MPVATSTAILIGTAVAAGTSSYFAKENLDAARDARRAQQNLEDRRRKELSDEAAARAAAEARAATTGQRAGRSAVVTGSPGFGTGSGAAGLTSGSLFGN